MKKIYAIISVLLIIVFLLLARGRMQTEQAKIMRNLTRIESLLSKEEGEPAAAGIIRANRAAEYFTGDCRVRANGFNISGKAELAAAIHNARSAVPGIRVRFHDVEITFKNSDTAEANLTATASARGITGETLAWEARIVLLRQDGEWNISNAETIEVLR